MRGHKERLINYLETHKTITSMEAIERLGNTRLAASIKDLRDIGYDISTIMIEGKNRYDEDVRFAKYVYRGRK